VPDLNARAHGPFQPLNNAFRFPSISILTQNVQSLNISSMCKKTSKKIFSVTRERDEIVLLSDIRLNSSKQVAATMDIENVLALGVINLYTTQH
jgi:hypothetical protein